MLGIECCGPQKTQNSQASQDKPGEGRVTQQKKASELLFWGPGWVPGAGDRCVVYQAALPCASCNIHARCFAEGSPGGLAGRSGGRANRCLLQCQTPKWAPVREGSRPGVGERAPIFRTPLPTGALPSSQEGVQGTPACASISPGSSGSGEAGKLVPNYLL